MISSSNIITDIQQIDRLKWKDFVLGHPDANIFQMPEMYDHFSAIPNYDPVLIIVTDDSGKINAVLLSVIIREKKFIPDWLSSRTVINGGPLIDPEINDKTDYYDRILVELTQIVKNRSLFIEFRNFTDLSSYKELFGFHGFDLNDHLNLIIETREPERVSTDISKSKQRQVKKSLKAGATIEEASTIDEVIEFYGILSLLYKSKVRKPLPSFQFFQNFFNGFVQEKKGIILLVKYEQKVIAGIVCPITPGKTIYEWYICGKDKEYREIHPSVLVTWAAINYAVNHKIPTFDFMGMGKPGKEYGVRKFKTSFGGSVVNYGRYVRINNRFIYTFAGLGFRILALLKRV